MQRSATVFHGVREAKVTTNWRGTESAGTYRFDPLRTVRVVFLAGKQVSAREALLQPTPCRSHSWNATDEAKDSVAQLTSQNDFGTTSARASGVGG